MKKYIKVIDGVAKTCDRRIPATGYTLPDGDGKTGYCGAMRSLDDATLASKFGEYIFVEVTVPVHDSQYESISVTDVVDDIACAVTRTSLIEELPIQSMKQNKRNLIENEYHTAINGGVDFLGNNFKTDDTMREFINGLATRIANGRGVPNSFSGFLKSDESSLVVMTETEVIDFADAVSDLVSDEFSFSLVRQAQVDAIHPETEIDNIGDIPTLTQDEIAVARLILEAI